jgi:hypothetical protein
MTERMEAVPNDIQVQMNRYGLTPETRHLAPDI